MRFIYLKILKIFMFIKSLKKKLNDKIQFTGFYFSEYIKIDAEFKCL